LTLWNLQQAHREVLHRSQREMELHDKNRDGFVSFSEYDPPSWVKSASNYYFIPFLFRILDLLLFDSVFFHSEV
jgi:hypothetical protein